MGRLAIASVVVLIWGSAGVFAQGSPSCEQFTRVPDGRARFLAFDRELRAGLSKNDPVILSMLAGFPLRVNSDQGTIQISNAPTLQARFEEIFPPAIRSAVLDQDAETVHCSFRGIMYGHGQVWIDLMLNGRYQITAINLPRSASASQLSPKLDFVCDAEKHRVVIDLNPDGTPRYRSWNKPRSLTETPDLEIAAGTKDYEGTGPCAHPIWRFEAGEAEFTVTTGGCSADSNPPLPEGYQGSLDVRVGKKSQRWTCF